MSAALSVRDAVNQLTASASTLEWHVDVSARAQRDLQFLHQLQPEATSCESALCELLQVSCVTLSDETRDTSNAARETSTKIAAIPTDSGTVRVQLSPTRLKLCPRCRRFTSTIDASLCPSCCSMTRAS